MFTYRDIKNSQSGFEQCEELVNKHIWAEAFKMRAKKQHNDAFLLEKLFDKYEQVWGVL